LLVGAEAADTLRAGRVISGRVAVGCAGEAFHTDWPGFTGLCLAPCRQLLQRDVRGLHGIEPPLQHACLVAGVTELRLQRLDRAALLGFAPVGPLRGLVDFPLQLRDGATLAIDLEQRALFRRTPALLRPFCRRRSK